MPFYVGSYLKNTRRLTPAEHGAYLLLMLEYWNTQSALPDDDDTLRLITSMTPDEWQKAKSKLLGFFSVSDGFWRHDRIEAEIAKASGIVERNRANGAKGGRPKTQNKPKPKPKTNPNKNTSTFNHRTVSIEETVLGAEAPSKRKSQKATRLPDDWHPPPEYLEHASTQGLSKAEADNEANRFRDYWIAKSGKDATKRDWLATWRNWIRNYLERRGSNGQWANAPGKVDDLRDMLDQAKEFDRSERESLPDNGFEYERRSIGAS